MRRALHLPLVGLVFGLVACGGGSSSEPSSSDDPSSSSFDPTGCGALARCCKQLSGSQHDACSKKHADLSQSPAVNADDLCSEAAASYCGGGAQAPYLPPSTGTPSDPNPPSSDPSPSPPATQTPSETHSAACTAYADGNCQCTASGTCDPKTWEQLADTCDTGYDYCPSYFDCVGSSSSCKEASACHYGC